MPLNFLTARIIASLSSLRHGEFTRFSLQTDLSCLSFIFDKTSALPAQAVVTGMRAVPARNLLDAALAIHVRIAVRMVTPSLRASILAIMENSQSMFHPPFPLYVRRFPTDRY